MSDTNTTANPNIDNEKAPKEKRYGMFTLIVLSIAITIVYYLGFYYYYKEFLFNRIELFNSVVEKKKTVLNFTSRFFSRIGLLFIVAFIPIFLIIIPLKVIVLHRKATTLFVIQEFMYNFIIFAFMYGFSMLTIGSVPLLPRIFENTFGYNFLGPSLKEITSKIFLNKLNPNDNTFVDYSVMVTPFYLENFFSFMKIMSSKPPAQSGGGEQEDRLLIGNPFGNIQLTPLAEGWLENPTPYDPNASADSPGSIMYKFFEKVVAKRNVSEAIWMLLTSYMATMAAVLYK